MEKFEDNLTFEDIINQTLKKVKVGSTITGTIVEINGKGEIFVDIGYKADGSKAYASYFSVSVPFVLGGLDWTIEAGATPWENDFYTGGENSSYSKDMINGFAVCEVGIEASKEIKISESWSLPLFAKAIWNPSTEGLYFVAGLSF